MKKINYDLEIKKEIISESVEKKLKFKLLYCRIVYLAIAIIILILCLIFNNRINMISKIYEEVFHIIGFLQIALYLSLIFVIFLNASLLFYSLYYIYKDNNWIKKSYKLYKIIDIPNFIFQTLYALIFIISFIITPCTVSGDSMMATLNDNDRLLCYSLFYEPKIDDIIIFNTRGINGENDLFIKRVVANEKSKIDYNESTNEFFVNDVFVDYLKDYQFNVIKSDLEIIDNEYYVPLNKVIVFGDNRDNSYDSRGFGLIEEKDVLGKIIIRIYPFNKIKDNILY